MRILITIEIQLWIRLCTEDSYLAVQTHPSEPDIVEFVWG